MDNTTTVNKLFEDFLMHYGKGHLDGGNSGRYPWGSGEDPYQSAGDFLSRVKELRSQNLTWYDPETGRTYTGDSAIAKAMGLSIKDFRHEVSVAKNDVRIKQYNRAKALYDSGMGYTEIARKMDLPNESSARSILNEGAKSNMEQAQKTADFLREQIEEKGMIDVGPGIEKELGISRTKLDDAIYILEKEGYVNIKSRIKNVTDPSGAHQTTLNVIAPIDTPKSAAYDYDKINFMSEEDYAKFKGENVINDISDYKTRDNGETYVKGFQYPESLDSSRLMVRYAEDGGINKDGVIEVKRGVEDLSLGNDLYSQCRIMVDGTHYLKGMAVYGDDSEFPDGVDVIFNTNKSTGTPVLGDKYTGTVLKEVKRDKDGNINIDNPFGSTIKEKGGQSYYIDENGNERLRLINKTKEAGDVGDWTDKLPSQFLSKQTESLAKRQLGLAIKDKKQEYNDICALENNTLKKELLTSFASDCDSASVHLYAASLPRQQYHFILPLTSIKDTEVYAPNYENGEKVALVRFPHEGTFQIPILTVNNKVAEGKKVIGNTSTDAIGISSAVAERLSGADFDGDTVIVIPTDNSTGIKIKSTPALEGLKNFDAKTEYKTTVKKDANGKDHYYNKLGEEVKIMSNTNLQMGVISNLITDMTIAGATDEEKARAVRHANVVIDAEKHKLDYKSSERENGISELKKKYQIKADNSTGGASTLLSQAKSEIDISKKEGTAKVNIKGKSWYDSSKPEGALIFKDASPDKSNYVTVKDDSRSGKKDVDVYTKDSSGKMKSVFVDNDGEYKYSVQNDKTGKKEYKKASDLYFFQKSSNEYKKITNEKLTVNSRTQKSTKMEETTDAKTLISKYNTKMEQLYAEYANSMKALANEARKTAYTTPNSEWNSKAKETYAKEYESLTTKIDISEKNAPRERQAQILATSRVKAKKDASSVAMKKDEVKKLSDQELKKARQEVGASRRTIDISDSEWEAIQAGALSSNQLTKIFRYADLDDVKERATPKERKTVTAAMESRIISMKDSGKTNAEIAAALGLSASTVAKYTK